MSTMNVTFRIFLLTTLVLLLATGVSAQEMTKEDWQKQITELTTKRDALKSRLDALNTEIEALKRQGMGKDEEIKRLEAEILALVGADAAAVAAFEATLNQIDQKLNELSALSPADLWARQKEIDDLQRMVNEAKKSRISIIPRYYDRLEAQQGRINGLRETLRKYSESMTYTVGTWSKDRDCLWNIAKKPSVYGNAFHWPKLWVGNRDKIKNPDIIYPGQKLRIPPKGALTSEENAAARSYWQQKQAAGSPNP
jgi:nucleoid-associated protein YgaU